MAAMRAKVPGGVSLPVSPSKNPYEAMMLCSPSIKGMTTMNVQFRAICAATAVLVAAGMAGEAGAQVFAPVKPE